MDVSLCLVSYLLDCSFALFLINFFSQVLQKWGEYAQDVQFILQRSALDGAAAAAAAAAAAKSSPQPPAMPPLSGHQQQQQQPRAKDGKADPLSILSPQAESLQRKCLTVWMNSEFSTSARHMQADSLPGNPSRHIRV